jgi:hypothetical protein
VQFDTQVKTAVYRWTVETTKPPTVVEMSEVVGAPARDVRESYRRLRASRVLFLEPDGETIRMAPPFSGVPTQHCVRVGGREYYANCSWDALGIPAALQEKAQVSSRCEQTLEPIRIEVGREGPEPVPVVAHFAVPAAKWWADLVYT